MMGICDCCREWLRVFSLGADLNLCAWCLLNCAYPSCAKPVGNCALCSNQPVNCHNI